MLAGYQPKLLLARFGGQWYLPRGRAHSTHILKPRLEGRPDGLAREHYGHALAAGLGLAGYRTELVGNGARQYLVIERYDRTVEGESVALVHQEDAAQALGLDWADDNAKFQHPLRSPEPADGQGCSCRGDEAGADQPAGHGGAPGRAGRGRGRAAPDPLRRRAGTRR